VPKKIDAMVSGEQPCDSAAECHFRGGSSFFATGPALQSRRDLNPIRGLVATICPQIGLAACLCFNGLFQRNLRPLQTEDFRRSARQRYASLRQSYPQSDNDDDDDDGDDDDDVVVVMMMMHRRTLSREGRAARHISRFARAPSIELPAERRYVNGPFLVFRGLVD
jgi:hypothetical protein